MNAVAVAMPVDALGRTPYVKPDQQKLIDSVTAKYAENTSFAGLMEELSALGLHPYQIAQNAQSFISPGGKITDRDGKAQSAKETLLTLNSQALEILQNNAHLANAIRPENLSEEGAANVLNGKDHYIDLNNDGLVEVGEAKLMIFPPLNSPKSVKDAWDAATAGMDKGDKLTFSGMMGLPLNLPGAKNQLSDMSSSGFNWGKLMQDMLYSNDAARRYNRPEMSDKVESWLTNFLGALKEQGLA